VVHHPQRDLGNAARKFAEFDAVELIAVDFGERQRIQRLLRGGVQLFQYLDLERPQFPVGG
jgi:hypothetical protein